MHQPLGRQAGQDVRLSNRTLLYDAPGARQNGGVGLVQPLRVESEGVYLNLKVLGLHFFVLFSIPKGKIGVFS